MATNPWGANPFRPNNTPSTNWGAGGFRTTPVGNQYLEEDSNRRAAYTLYNQDNQINPLNNRGSYYDRLFGQVSQGYEANLADQPELTFEQYYRMIQPQLEMAYNNATPDQRGENVTKYARIARTIPRGY